MANLHPHIQCFEFHGENLTTDKPGATEILTTDGHGWTRMGSGMVDANFANWREFWSVESSFATIRAIRSKDSLSVFIRVHPWLKFFVSSAVVTEILTTDGHRLTRMGSGMVDA